MSDLGHYDVIRSPVITEKSTMASEMLQPLLLMIFAFYCLFTCSLLLNMRAEILRRESATGWVRRLVAGGEDARVL